MLKAAGPDDGTQGHGVGWEGHPVAEKCPYPGDWGTILSLIRAREAKNCLLVASPQAGSSKKMGCEVCPYSLYHSQGTAACSGDQWMSGRLHGAVPQGQRPLLVSSMQGPQPKLSCLLNE